MIIDNALQEYASLLEDNGFTVYEPKGNGNYFRYSQVVDGRECFGYVQRGWGSTGRSYQHLMPIQPSIEHGANLAVPGADGLTVEAARRVAQPFNRNDVAGSCTNWADPRWEDLYVERANTFLPDSPMAGGSGEATP